MNLLRENLSPDTAGVKTQPRGVRRAKRMELKWIERRFLTAASIYHRARAVDAVPWWGRVHLYVIYQAWRGAWCAWCLWRAVLTAARGRNG